MNEVHLADISKWHYRVRVEAAGQVTVNIVNEISPPYRRIPPEAQREVCGCYDSINETPKWMQEKYAVLSILEKASNMPASVQDIKGVGSKLEKDNTYWIEEE